MGHDGIPPRQFNAAFAEKLLHGTPGDLVKMAQALTQTATDGGIIQDRDRGRGFCEAFIPSQPISADELVLGGDMDVPYKFEYLQPGDPAALSVNFSGGTDAKLIRARRTQIGLFSIQLEKLTFEIQKLRFHPVSVRDAVLKRVDESVEDVKDRQVVTHLEAGLQALQTVVNGSTVALNKTTATDGSCTEKAIMKSANARAAASLNYNPTNVTRNDITRALRAFSGRDGRMMTCKGVIMSDWDFYGFADIDFDTIGGDYAARTFRDGVPEQPWHGKKVVTTNKTHILRPGNIYFVAAPEFLGRHYKLDKLQLFIKVESYHTVQIEGFETCGFAFINLWGAKKMETYSSSSTPGAVTDADDVLEVIAVAEADLRRDNLSDVAETQSPVTKRY